MNNRRDIEIIKEGVNLFMNNQHVRLSRIAGGQNKQFTPYFNQLYTLPKQVKQLYETPTTHYRYRTPAFIKQDESFTSQDEMMTFINKLSNHNELLQLEIIAHSLEGREIPILIFSTSHHNEDEFQRKPTVWLQAQIHGDEPAAGEAALVIAKKLSRGTLGDRVLQAMNIVIIPRINPDSAFYFQRHTVTGLNGNREHLNLGMVELKAIHQVFNKYNPEVVIDTHEYGLYPQFNDIGLKGSLKHADVLIQTGKNLNIPKSLREKSDSLFKHAIFSTLKQHGFSYDTYYTVSDSTGKRPKLFEGGTNATIGRNVYALKPSFSILVETLGIGLGRENFARRVMGQVLSYKAIIETVRDRASDIQQAVTTARNNIRQSGCQGQDNGLIILSNKLKKVDNRTIDIVDVAQGSVVRSPMIYYSATDAVATLKRKRPNAYLLPPGFNDVIKKLQIHGVEIDQLDKDRSITVECFHVVKREVINEGRQPKSKLTTNITTEERLFLRGSYFIRSDQVRALIASLALEPESPASYFTHNIIASYVATELPVYRYFGNMDVLSKNVEF